LFKVRVNLVRIALWAEVTALGQDTTRLVRVFDHVIFAVDGLGRGGRFGEVHDLPIGPLDFELRWAVVAALVVRAGNVAGRCWEGQGSTLWAEHGVNLTSCLL